VGHQRGAVPGNGLPDMVDWLKDVQIVDLINAEVWRLVKPTTARLRIYVSDRAELALHFDPNNGDEGTYVMVVCPANHK
jgi:hypothetical protein